MPAFECECYDILFHWYSSPSANLCPPQVLPLSLQKFHNLDLASLSPQIKGYKFFCPTYFYISVAFRLGEVWHFKYEPSGAPSITNIVCPLKMCRLNIIPSKRTQLTHILLSYSYGKQLGLYTIKTIFLKKSHNILEHNTWKQKYVSRAQFIKLTSIQI